MIIITWLHAWVIRRKNKNYKVKEKENNKEKLEYRKRIEFHYSYFPFIGSYKEIYINMDDHPQVFNQISYFITTIILSNNYSSFYVKSCSV